MFSDLQHFVDTNSSSWNSKEFVVRILSIFAERLDLTLSFRDSENLPFEVASVKKDQGVLLVKYGHLDRTFIHRIVRLFEVIWYPIFVSSKIEFLVSVGDRNLEPYAGLAMSSDSKLSVLIPDVYFLGSRGYQRERIAIDQALADIENSRINLNRRAYWRGSLTGHRPWLGGRWRNQRLDLCELSLGFEGEFDCKITQWWANGDDEFAEFASTSPAFEKGTKPFLDSLRYAVHVDVDGMGTAWNGLFLKLYTGRPVLKVRSLYGLKQWYYDRLIGGVNVVWVAADLSDLVDQYRELVESPDELVRIGQNGRELVKSMTYQTELRLAQESLMKFALV